ncbi:DNA replication/repair protein RecF [Nigerium massiliense]|uniref:DNA replication/repair protein RecF n=1 Tax=Nigerium massiliense TaxID=1522317 RepID=UPI00058D3615|nr:DNA replication/repair protein RecF [Nigerium massiliense]
MFVTHLSLADFRSYPHVEAALEPGVTVFTGRNGQGKTNLVEAVEYLATLGSHRVAADAPLIRFGSERAIVRGRVQAAVDDPRQLLLEIEINQGKANKASLNRGPLKRPRDLLGALRVVLFSPEDLALVKGDPSDRRRFIDDLVTQRWPRMAGVRADYDRVLRQRSMLLKSLSGRRGPVASEAESTLDVWDESLAGLGAEVMATRLTTLADMTDGVSEAYAAIAPSNNDARLSYRSSILGDAVDVVAAAELGPAELRERLRVRMGERRRAEIQRGVSLVGPHRDDLVLTLGPLPAKGYASHGESWSFALALRLGSEGVLRADGVEPVLILDDVFAELDEVRRDRLAARIAGAEQVLITAAVAGDVPEELHGRRFIVEGGEVRLDDADA